MYDLFGGAVAEKLHNGFGASWQNENSLTFKDDNAGPLDEYEKLHLEMQQITPLVSADGHTCVTEDASDRRPGGVKPWQGKIFLIWFWTHSFGFRT